MKVAHTCQTAMRSLGAQGSAEKGDNSAAVSSAQKGCLTVHLIVGESGGMKKVSSNETKDKPSEGKMGVQENSNITTQEIIRVPLPPGFTNVKKTFLGAVQPSKSASPIATAKSAPQTVRSTGTITEISVKPATLPPAAKTLPVTTQSVAVGSRQLVTTTLSTSTPTSTSTSMSVASQSVISLSKSVIESSQAALTKSKSVLESSQSALATSLSALATSNSKASARPPTYLTNLPSVLTNATQYPMATQFPVSVSKLPTLLTMPLPALPKTLATTTTKTPSVPSSTTTTIPTTVSMKEEDKVVDDAPEDDPGGDQSGLPRVIPKGKKQSRYRHSQRLRMRPWLLMLLNTGEVPGLQWVQKEEKIFSIPWKHASGRTWKGEDADLFERYALHTGKHWPGGQPDHKRWKANFRCALNSLHDVEELSDQSMKTGEFAYKLYRFLEGEVKKSRKGSNTGKMRDRRLSDSSGGDVGDMSEDQISSDGVNGSLSKRNLIDAQMKVKDTCPPDMPEIKDHNYYSFNKNAGVSPNECVRVIDADAVRKLLRRTNTDGSTFSEKQDEEDDVNLEPKDYSMNTSPRLPHLRSSVDETIDAVVAGKQNETANTAQNASNKRIKSELIIDDGSAHFVSNVMEVDTSPDCLNHLESKARFSSAKSLASLSHAAAVVDKAEEDLAASILLDLSRVKRQPPKPPEIVGEKMEEDEEMTQTSSQKPEVFSSKRQLIKTLMNDPVPGPSGSSENRPAESHGEIEMVFDIEKTVLPLDLRIKTEPMDEAYEIPDNSTFETSVSETHNAFSPNAELYRSQRDNSDSDDDEETSFELVPPPAHSFCLQQSPAVDDNLPQPLDLSVKVHNLMIGDSKEMSPGATRSHRTRSFAEAMRQSPVSALVEDRTLNEPLDLQVKKAHNNCRENPSTSGAAHVYRADTNSDTDAIEQMAFPLDLSIVKTEPMDDSFEDISEDIPPQDSSPLSDDSIPELIQAPGGNVKEEQRSQNCSPASEKTESESSNDAVPIALFVNQDREDVSISGNEPKMASLNPKKKSQHPTSTVSSPIIKSLLQRKLPTKRPLTPSCILCSRSFQSHDELSKHMLSVHTNDATDLSLAKKKLYQCPVCGRTFKEGTRLEKHMLIHKREAKIRCSECKEIFENREKYLEHSETCSPAGLRCNSCGEVFTGRQEYSEHMEAKHSEAVFLMKPYQCAICNSAFESCELLQKHMECHRSGGVLAPCAKCKNFFSLWKYKNGNVSSLCGNCEVESSEKEDVPQGKPNLSGMSVLLQAVERSVKGSEQTNN